MSQMECINRKLSNFHIFISVFRSKKRKRKEKLKRENSLRNDWKNETIFHKKYP